MGTEASSGALGLAGDVIAASAALAGLILVYLGAVASGYASFEKTQQGSVRASFQRRAWFGVVGILFSIAACGSAALAKWLTSACMAGVSLVLFALTLFWAALSAILIALEVK